MGAMAKCRETWHGSHGERRDHGKKLPWRNVMAPMRKTTMILGRRPTRCVFPHEIVQHNPHYNPTLLQPHRIVMDTWETSRMNMVKDWKGGEEKRLGLGGMSSLGLPSTQLGVYGASKFFWERWGHKLD